MSTRYTAEQCQRDTDAYVESILGGQVAAGLPERLAVERYGRDLQAQCWDLDWEAVARVRNIFAVHFKHVKGKMAGRPWLWAPWMVFLAANIFGFKLPGEDRRRFTSSFNLGAKGSGKSPWWACASLYFCGFDREPRAECFIGARTADQAKIPYDFAALTLKQNPLLEERFISWGGHNAWSITHPESESFIKREAGTTDAEGRSGPNLHFALVDEYHEARSDAQLEYYRMGVKDRRQPHIAVVTNAGQLVGGPCRAEYLYAKQILEQQVENDRYFVSIFEVDEGDEPLEDETCWRKANPTLPDAPGYEYIRDQVQGSQGNPAKQALVLRLCFSIWTEALNPWFDLQALRDVWVPRPEWQDAPPGTDAWVGMDLSHTRKLTSLTLAARHEGRYKVQTKNWVVGRGLEKRQLEERTHRLYGWSRQPDQCDLVAVREPTIDYALVVDTLKEWMGYYNIRALVSDQFKWSDFAEAMKAGGLEWTRNKLQASPRCLLMATHGFNFTAEARKSQEPQQDGSLHFYMPRSIAKFEAVLENGLLDILFDVVLRYSMLATQVQEDTVGNRRLTSEDPLICTDPCITTVIAIGAAEHFETQVGRVHAGMGSLGVALAHGGLSNDDPTDGRPPDRPAPAASPTASAGRAAPQDQRDAIQAAARERAAARIQDILGRA